MIQISVIQIHLNTVVLLFYVLQDPDDLPFSKGEVLTIIQKDEDQWWTARNSVGQIGSIPVPYVQKVVVFKKIY